MVETETEDKELSAEEQEALLLDFSEVASRRKHPAPNGGTYEVRTLDDFGLIDEHRLGADRDRFAKLEKAAKLSKAQAAEYDALLRDMFARIVVADEETIASFNDRQKRRVLMFFTTTQLADQAQVAKAARSLISRGNDSTTET